MISAEAPILFAKGCDIFITELTMRAWIHAEENKRRTLQRSDIASALAKSDMFDFLIDIVPREEASSHAKRASGQAAGGGVGAPQGQSSSAAGGGQLPPQPVVPPQPQPGHAQQHPLSSQEPYLPHGMAQDQDYRPGMYPPGVQPSPQGAYGQPQAPIYGGEIEGMYGYTPMPPQQVSRTDSLRGQSSSPTYKSPPRCRIFPSNQRQNKPLFVVIGWLIWDSYTLDVPCEPTRSASAPGRSFCWTGPWTCLFAA
jgi:hypothetical protein